MLKWEAPVIFRDMLAWQQCFEFQQCSCEVLRWEQHAGQPRRTGPSEVLLKSLALPCCPCWMELRVGHALSLSSWQLWAISIASVLVGRWLPRLSDFVLPQLLKHLTVRRLGMSPLDATGLKSLATPSAETEAVFSVPTLSAWPFTGMLWKKTLLAFPLWELDRPQGQAAFFPGAGRAGQDTQPLHNIGGVFLGCLCGGVSPSWALGCMQELLTCFTPACWQPESSNPHPNSFGFTARRRVKVSWTYWFNVCWDVLLFPIHPTHLLELPWDI